VHNTYYYVGQNTAVSAPSDVFHGGINGAWNTAILPDARENYAVATNAGTTTVTNIDPLHLHAGTLSVDNVQVLAFDPDHDPLPHADGSLEATGDTLLVLSPFSGAATIDAGATLELAASDSGTVTFNGVGGTLRLDQPSTFTGHVAGLDADDFIDVIGFDPHTATASYSGTNSSGTLTVSDATHTVANGTAATIALQGNYLNSTFTTSSDGHGGVLVVDPPATPTPPAAPVTPSEPNAVVGTSGN